MRYYLAFDNDKGVSAKLSLLELSEKIDFTSFEFDEVVELPVGGRWEKENIVVRRTQ
jgi:hypothetical protein